MLLIVKIFINNHGESAEKLDREIKRLTREKEMLQEELQAEHKEVKRLEEATKSTFISEQLAKMQKLEDEVAKQKQRVQEAKSIAQDAMAVKYEFLANIRHEIRTPMNSILAFADLLKQEIDNPKQLSYVTNIYKSGNNLLSFMDDIIELSRLESGAFDINESAIDIIELLNTTLEEYKAEASKKGLDLELEIDDAFPQSLILDEQKVHDILSNLIDNAIKFTHNGYVKVSAGVKNFDVEKNEVDIAIAVKDSGVGIDAANFSKIFEMFEKAENATALEFQSTGLGLSINRKMARFMNGDITLSSKLNEGSLFEFTLNGVEVVLASADDATQEEVDVDFTLIKPEGAKVMVVDENGETREMIEDAFRESAVDVISFDHPRDAIESLKESRYDLIFIDITILSADNSAVSKVIAGMCKAPVVSLTVARLKSIEFVEGGANIVGHLKKPISKVALFQISLKILNNAKQFATKVVKPSASYQNIDMKSLGLFFMEHDKKIAELYEKASKTNDLNAITLFAKELFKLSYQLKITPLTEYSKELLSKIELFDIDTIHIMMQEYNSKIESLRKLSL